MTKRIDNITACIIAGGKSSRFGRDKSSYMLKGKPLIEHVLCILNKIFIKTAIISGGTGKFSYLNLPVFSDIVPDLGPIGGLYTALKRCRTEKIFLVACDMPNLNPGLIGYMASIADGFDIVVPFYNNNYEALHAIYSLSCINPIAEQIKHKKRKVISFFDDVKVREVSEEEISKYTDINRVFMNINYIHDIE